MFNLIILLIDKLLFKFFNFIFYKIFLNLNIKFLIYIKISFLTN